MNTSMIRHLRDLLSLVCLPFLVLVLVMWARSYFVLDRLSYRSVDNQDCHLRSDFGHITWFWTTPVFPHRHLSAQLTAAGLPGCSRLIAVWESLGFHHEFDEIPAKGNRPAIARSLTMIPYWFLFAMSGLAPLSRLRGKWRRIAANGIGRSDRFMTGAAQPDRCL
jgi:hypothetical protein